MFHCYSFCDGYRPTWLVKIVFYKHWVCYTLCCNFIARGKMQAYDVRFFLD